MEILSLIEMNIRTGKTAISCGNKKTSIIAKLVIVSKHVKNA
jgi:hypothetical protein